MNMLARRVMGVIDNDLQVSGIFEFPESRWREAILFYLFGIWSEKLEVCDRAKITFGTVTLRLDDRNSEYYAYGRPHEVYPHQLFRDEETNSIGCEQVIVEYGLIHFVKSNRIKVLLINFPDGGQLQLWKKERRGQYGYGARDIPVEAGGLGPSH